MPSALLIAAAQQPQHHHALMHFMMSLGPLGLFLLSVVDASFVPIPVPGSTDLMIALLASRSHTWLLYTVVATLGSALGGAACYYVGSLGGVHMLEKRVPPKYFKPLTRWVSEHAYLAVAIPAILPPPFPLIPFVLAAGALKMPPRKFGIAFTVSRCFRHALFAWLGLRFASHLRSVWHIFESPWAGWVLAVFWIAVIVMATIGIYRLVQTQRGAKQTRNATAEATA